jgi:CRP/FNR family transcriptional regulator
MKKMDMAVLASVIGRSGFFKGLSPDACRDLARVARVRELSKKEVLFAEGQVGGAIFILLSGRIQLHKSSPDGSETVIRIVGAGEVFAEVVLLERQDYPVTAVSLSTSSVAILPRRDVLKLLEDVSFRNSFIATMLRRQRYLADRVRYLTACDVQERLFIFLREQYGPLQRITVDLSKKDIAAAIGTTPETLSRLIQRLQEENLIRWHGRNIAVQASAWEPEHNSSTALADCRSTDGVVGRAFTARRAGQ